MKLTMVGRLTDCILLAYRTPADSVRNLLPRGMELITHGKWAFWNVLICQVEKMRTRNMPAFLGVSYFDVAYRLYVRVGDHVGLYFLRSDINSALVSATGNLMTDFHFHSAKIESSSDDMESRFTVTTKDRLHDAHVTIKSANSTMLVPNSCFTSIEEAKKTLHYRPFALSIKNNTLHIAQVIRDERNWHETPINVLRADFAFFKQEDIHLELATRIAPIDYVWKLGRREVLDDSISNHPSPKVILPHQ